MKNNFLRKLFSFRKRSDKGAADLVSFLILTPLVIAIASTIIDTTIFLMNRSAITDSVKTVSRTVAIMGGDGGTSIEKKYGMSHDEACKNVANNSVVSPTLAAKVGSLSVSECSVLNGYSDGNLVNVKIMDVACSPEKTTAIGQKTKCEVWWEYHGVPTSALRLYNYSKNPDSNHYRQYYNYGMSETEVNMAAK